MATYISKVIPFLLIIILPFGNVKAQDSIVTMVSGNLSMEVHRDYTGVWVVMSFTDPSIYSYVIVEKGRWNEGDFRQCAIVHLPYQNITGSIETNVDFPLSPFYDGYYRIKAITSDGIETTFPPVMLPACAGHAPEVPVIITVQPG